MYHEDNDNLIGAEVIVYDGDTPIDSILITSKSSYDELVEEMANLSSRFVSFHEQSELSGKTIEEILANSENETDINASLLNGHTPNYYAKASHNHIMSHISDLKTYEISLSNYNPIIGFGTPATTTATVTVKSSAGAPVANEPVILSIDGTNYNGTTDINGKFSMNFSTYEPGIHTFSVKNQKTQCFAKRDTGWQHVNVTIDNLVSASDTPLRVRRIGDVVHLQGAVMVVDHVSVPSKLETFGDYINQNAPIDAQFRPTSPEIGIIRGSLRKSTIMSIVWADGIINIFDQKQEYTLQNGPIPVGTWLPINMTWVVG